ncbi:MAG: NAD(P)/FAD-dependent oxidoreductase [Candidatus Thorarchaeota archaeon]
MDRNVDHFDICIIGGSIAGNYLCYLLSKTNLKILVIEEHEEIGYPLQCAGIVSQKLSNLIDLPKEIIINRVNIAKIVSPSGDYIELSGAERPYIIDRIALDKLFYDKVKDLDNISYYFEEKFKSFKYIIENKKTFILIETSKRKVKSNILVGCDGPLSVVGKNLGIKNKILFASQIRVKSNFDQNEAAMYFNPKWKELFGWIVPEGKNVFRIGLASLKNVNSNFKMFLKLLKVNENQALDKQGGVIPYGIMNKVAFDNLILLGDSACQVKATTGGGIILLLISAKYAARCIYNCFKNNNFTKKFIKRNYETPCASIVGRQLKIHYLIRNFLENLTNKDFKSLFKIIKTTKIEHLISFYGDMDFPRALVLKLLKNPLVFSFLLKYLLKNPTIIMRFLKILKV